MTIDTIKDVLGRIISINKNLTAESLRNLLTASGWDMHDIDEGLKVFQDFNYSGEKPVAAPPPIMQKPVDATPKAIVEADAVSKIDVSKNINQNTANQSAALQQIDNSIMQRQPQTVSLDPLPTKPISPLSSASVYQSPAVYQPLPVKIVEAPPIINTQYNDNSKEWGIISLDIILFLIVLGLLLYILLR